MKDMLGGCCVCSGVDGWDYDPLVFCDGQGCSVAVHKTCYGIVTVPSGPWFCRKCENRETGVKVSCELCPSKTGAFKRTDNERWAHVVCALYIPEIKFGDVTTMEPIILNLTPQERFYKSCCICESQGKESKAKIGACMNCNKTGCKNQFHVTCAQALGLLCEAAGNFSTVKYCGYCPHHHAKLKKGTKVRAIPAFKSAATGQSKSAPEKSTSSTTGSLEHLSGRSSTKTGKEERKRKKHSSKSSGSAVNRDFTSSELPIVLLGVGLTPKQADADQNSSSEAVNQEADNVDTESIKSNGSRKKIKLPRFVARVPSLIKRLSVPAMVPGINPSTAPIAPEVELSTSSKDSAESCAPSSSSNSESTVTATDVGVTGPSTSNITSDVKQIEASQSNLTVKELPSKPDPDPLPKIKKPRRSKLPKASPLATDSLPNIPDSTTGKRSSKRRKKEDNKPSKKLTSSTIDDLLHPPSHPKVEQPDTKVSPSFHLQELTLIPEAPSPDSYTALKAPPTVPNVWLNAPQMLGNELNPNSRTAKEMTESLSAEVDRQNAFTAPSPTTSSSLADVPFPRRSVSLAVNQAVAALSSAPAPHHLEDLLERQWGQGSHLLMEQAQHYDIASLLSCLNIIRQDNSLLEDHVAGLTQRRDRLLAVNARLSIPLTVQPHAPFVTNNLPDGTSTEGSLNGHLMEISLQERSSHVTPYGISTAEQHLEAGSRVNHPVHPTGGLPSTMSPIQGSTGFSSFTPEMSKSTGTSTTEQHLPGLHPHSFHPVSVPTVPDQRSHTSRREKHLPPALC